MKITLAEIKSLIEQAKDELNKECPASVAGIELISPGIAKYVATIEPTN